MATLAQWWRAGGAALAGAALLPLLSKCVLHFWERRKLNWQLYINRYPHSQRQLGREREREREWVPQLPLPLPYNPLRYPLHIVHFLHLAFRFHSQLQPGSCRRWLCTCPEIVRLCTEHSSERGRSEAEAEAVVEGAPKDTRNLCSLHIIQMMPHYISHSMVSSLQLNECRVQSSPPICHWIGFIALYYIYYEVNNAQKSSGFNPKINRCSNKLGRSDITII